MPLGKTRGILHARGVPTLEWGGGIGMRGGIKSSVGVLWPAWRSIPGGSPLPTRRPARADHLHVVSGVSTCAWRGSQACATTRAGEPVRAGDFRRCASVKFLFRGWFTWTVNMNQSAVRCMTHLKRSVTNPLRIMTDRTIPAPSTPRGTYTPIAFRFRCCA